MIDWTKLQHPLDEKLFERICGDILRGLGLRVEPGPNVPRYTLLLHPEEGPPILAGCWPERFLGEDQLSANLIECLSNIERDRQEGVLIVTDGMLPAPSKRLIDKLNGSRGNQAHIGWLEGESLQRLLLCQRKIYRKYFVDQLTLSEDLDCSSVRSPNIVCSLASSTHFLQNDTVLKVRITNAGPSSAELHVHADEKIVKTIRIGTFDSQSISILPSEVNPADWPDIRLVPAQASAKIPLKTDRAAAPRLSVDHIYVDPLHWCSQVQKALESQNFVYLSGGPGAGKSRLLREACGLGQRPIWIDLSQGNYGTVLVDHLLSHLFDLDLATLRRFKESFLLSRLQALGCDEVGAHAVLRYLKEDKETVGKKAFAKTLGLLSASVFEERVLVIDNIHRLRHLDSEILRNLVSEGYPGSIIFTARDKEIETPELEIFLDSIAGQDRFVHVVLDRVPVSRLIGCFLEKATADESSQRFLSVLRHAPNMQQFILAIKSLRARQLLDQEVDGRLRVVRGGDSIKLAEYREILFEMLTALGEQARVDGLKRTLELAAVYGFTFDIQFLLEQMGEEVESLLELLEEKELIISENGSTECYRFDHELTHEIVYNTISRFRLGRMTRAVIQYIEAPKRYEPGEHDGLLSQHCEVISEFGKSAEYSLKRAKFLLGRSGVTEGHSEYERALSLSEQLRLVSTSTEQDHLSYVLEANALEGCIDTGTLIYGSQGVYHKVRQLDTLMKLYPADNPDRERLLGRVAYYFGRHFNLTGDHSKSRAKLAFAIQQLTAVGALANLGETLTRACTLEKNCGRWDEAKRYGEQAIEVFQRVDDSAGLSLGYVDLGAVFLEAGEPEKAVPMWKQAVEVVQGQGAEQATCSAQVDYAYILALVHPRIPEVEDELRTACSLAKRLAMDSDEARARLNFANWLHFHGDEPTIAREHLQRAFELITKIDDEYLRNLYLFSQLNIEKGMNKEQRESIEDRITEVACTWVARQGGLETTGDNRILNMIEYLSRRGVQRALSFLPTNIDAGEYYRGRPNPYRINDNFITLY